MIFLLNAKVFYSVWYFYTHNVRERGHNWLFGTHSSHVHHFIWAFKDKHSSYEKANFTQMYTCLSAFLSHNKLLLFSLKHLNAVLGRQHNMNNMELCGHCKLM